MTCVTNEQKDYSMQNISIKVTIAFEIAQFTEMTIILIIVILLCALGFLLGMLFLSQH